MEREFLFGGGAIGCAVKFGEFFSSTCWNEAGWNHAGIVSTFKVIGFTAGSWIAVKIFLMIHVDKMMVSKKSQEKKRKKKKSGTLQHINDTAGTSTNTHDAPEVVQCTQTNTWLHLVESHQIISSSRPNLSSSHSYTTAHRHLVNSASAWRWRLQNFRTYMWNWNKKHAIGRFGWKKLTVRLRLLTWGNWKGWNQALSLVVRHCCRYRGTSL